MNKIKALFTVVLMVSCFSHGAAQSSANRESVDNFNQWFMFSGEYNTESKWAANLEVHARVANLGESWQQWLVRPAVLYRPSANLQLALGYTWLQNFPYGEQPIVHTFPEHNVWQEVLIKHKLSTVPLYHRLRLEERFIGIEEPDTEQVWHVDHYNSANRFRYRIGSNVSGKGKWTTYQFSVFNEAFVDTKQSPGGYFLNQNWLYGGIGKQLNKSNSVHLGYQHQWIRKADGIHVENNDIIQLSWKLKLDAATFHQT